MVDAGVGAASGVRVFISYAHDSPDHGDAVRNLWLLLRRCGVDAKLDVVAAQQPRDWTLWMLAQIRQAAFVLVIASPEYRRRAEGEGDPAQ
ncbi:TIR domain-containing protein, partial [Candidatus Protofrankia datiscae]